MWRKQLLAKTAGSSNRATPTKKLDVIEEHNLSNQWYAPRHVGMSKVTALRRVIAERRGEHLLDERVRELPASAVGEQDVGILVDGNGAGEVG